MSLHRGYRLYVSPSTYVLEPTGSSDEALRIDRASRAVSLAPPTDGRGETVLPVQALVGLIPLAVTDYLIVVTASSKVATLLGADVFRATKFQILPVVPASAEATLKRNTTEAHLVSLLVSHLHSGAWYFSYAYDLTNSLQRQTALAASDPQHAQPAYAVADDRFFWNKYASEKLIDAARTSAPALARFIQPIVYGFLEARPVKINGRDFVFALISRRSRYRAGTRYFSRGLDDQGHVSNFNETEQIVLADTPEENAKRPGPVVGPAGYRLSLVQIRGSVPVYWAEVNNMRYKPDLLVKEAPETLAAAKKHFGEEEALYGDIYIANLVNQKGYEMPVKDAFERAVAAIGDEKVHYTYFDFHHECRGMHYENIDKLLATLTSKGLPPTSYFADVPATTGKELPKQVQTGVLRTNCMDCLDRTNVVQAAYAKAVLTVQLTSLGITKPSQTLEEYPELWSIFRNVWADHADVISKAYSGTGALKTDYTRTGVRTKQGLLQDGVNSLTRYVKNNYYDGSRQDAYDVFTGRWTPAQLTSVAGGDPWLDERPVAEQAVPYVAIFAAGMITAAAVLPRTSTAPLFWFVALWLVLLGAAVRFMAARGIDYVNWPRLAPLTDNIFYEGPGYYSGRKGRAGVKGLAGKNMKKTTRGSTVAPTITARPTATAATQTSAPAYTSPAGATGVAPTLTSAQQRHA